MGFGGFPGVLGGLGVLGFTVNSRKLEHGLQMTNAGIPFSIPFRVWG